MHKITKKILSMAMLVAVLGCALIFSTCGELELDENVYTVTFIAVYSVSHTETEIQILHDANGDPLKNNLGVIIGDPLLDENGVQLIGSEGVLLGKPLYGKKFEHEYDVYYDAFTGNEVKVYDQNAVPGVLRQTNGVGRLASFPPNPGRLDDYSFDGWYTTGGTRVTEQTIFTTHTRVRARWKAGASIRIEQGDVAKEFARIKNALDKGLPLSDDKPDEVTVTITANESLKPITLGVNPAVTPMRKVNIILKGITVSPDPNKPLPYLTISESGSLFTVGGNVTYTYNASRREEIATVIGSVTLTLVNVRMEGNDRNTKSLLTVNAGGKMIIGENASDQSYIFLNGSEDERSGGAVTVNKDGELIMNGGQIYQCTVHARPYDDPNSWPGGGGVLVRGGTFTMTGGNIERCYGSFNGGGVLVDLGGRFIMEGGQLYDNTAPYGGGASTYRGGWFEMKGTAVIKENLAREGAGVFVDGGAEHTIPYDPRRRINFRGMDYGEGGMSYYDTGGNYYDATKPINDSRLKEGFYMRGGTILDNHAVSDGGGISNYAGGIVYMTGGTVRGNLADDFGGGVNNMGLFIMIGGTIQGNRARYGGGVMAAINMFAFEAGNIIGNRATVAGGGLFLLQGSFSMLGSAALLDSNTADGFGGGLAIYPEGTFAMAGGTISRNRITPGYNGYTSEGTLAFFDSTDPQLLGFALFGIRPLDKVENRMIPGDPIIDHGGRYLPKPGYGAMEWIIETYLVRFTRSAATNLVYNLLPWGENANITVVDGTATITGVTGAFSRDMTYTQGTN